MGLPASSFVGTISAQKLAGGHRSLAGRPQPVDCQGPIAGRQPQMILCTANNGPRFMIERMKIGEAGSVWRVKHNCSITLIRMPG